MINILYLFKIISGLVAQWIELLTTDQTVGGSSPFEIAFFFIKNYEAFAFYKNKRIKSNKYEMCFIFFILNKYN